MRPLLLFCTVLLLLPACSRQTLPDPLFVKLSPKETGIDFVNLIGEVSYQRFTESPYIYNGAGVAAGDFNNDGYTDLFFAGNLVSSRLYLNRGDFQFEDVTEASGVVTDRWITGVSLIDINSNGYLDIYLVASGEPGTPPEERTNLLFINNGDMTFREAASGYGLDDSGYGTHAVFFDYNRNGYPDLFLMNNSPVSFSRKGGSPFFVPDDPTGYDKLYRNNGDGTFTDVSLEAGILRQTGFGLGVVVLDINRNGWPDLYISNDNIPNDVLYMNNGDGTFTNRVQDVMMHTSFSGMGVDAADFINNGWPDLAQTDMMPESLTERRKMSGGNTWDRFQNQRAFGLHYYYPNNTLQMNHGVDAKGRVQFSEVSRMAGVSYTDWTWSVLFADLNNSGYRDLVITNGYPRDVINHQYLMTIDSEVRSTAQAENERKEALFRGLRDIHLPNYIFRNRGKLAFEDVSDEWGFREPGYSYGMVYADLNNNGKLDLVINNIDSPASIYRNETGKDEPGNYLQIKLEGEAPNRLALGAEVTLYHNGSIQYHYHTIYRGFQSTVDSKIHFGLGSLTAVDSLQVIWPDERVTRIDTPDINRILIIRQADAADPQRRNTAHSASYLFTEIDSAIGYLHREKRVTDFLIQPTLPSVKSAQGPVLAAGDITGNGLEDLFVGGISGEPGRLFIHEPEGVFTLSAFSDPWDSDAMYEDTAALFFDFNGNGLRDLYVGSGGYHQHNSFGLLQDRLYINTGGGRFLRDRQALPVMQSDTRCVEKGDVTGDGRDELFICGGVYPGNYPFATESFLLKEQSGRFRDILPEWIPGFPHGAIHTAAILMDFTGNGHIDLITAGLWEPLRLFENSGGQLEEITSETGFESTRGWWYSLASGDFNGNGYPDIAAGNLGLNHTFRTAAEEPFGLIAGDLDGTGTTDLIFFVEKSGREMPFFGPFRLSQSIRNYYSRISEPNRAANSPVDGLFTRDVLNSSARFYADTFASALFMNSGEGAFSHAELPEIAQISALNAILAEDLDRDGCIDLLVAGNIFKTDPDIPRLDGGKGLFMKGDCEGEFRPESLRESGFTAPLDAKAMILLKGNENSYIAVGNNDGPLQIFLVNREDL
ncbi:MAG: RNA-binding protein [Balneolaceae bacterium]|nr:MAG: RNA-binding protein [Balneolaceae bacterium]